MRAVQPGRKVLFNPSKVCGGSGKVRVTTALRLQRTWAGGEPAKFPNDRRGAQGGFRQTRRMGKSSLTLNLLRGCRDAKQECARANLELGRSEGLACRDWEFQGTQSQAPPGQCISSPAAYLCGNIGRMQSADIALWLLRQKHQNGLASPIGIDEGVEGRARNLEGWPVCVGWTA